MAVANAEEEGEHRRRLPLWVEGMFDLWLRMVMDFLRVWYDRLRLRDHEIREVGGKEL